MALQSHITEVVERMNASDNQPDEDSIRELTDYMNDESEVWELEADSTLSPREAEFVVLKRLGLSIPAIQYYFAMHGGVVRPDENDPILTSEGAFDELNRRAMEKYERARATVEALEDLH